MRPYVLEQLKIEGVAERNDKNSAQEINFGLSRHAFKELLMSA